MALSDKQLDKLLAGATKATDVKKALEGLATATERLADERGAGDPSIGRVWEAMSELVVERDVPEVRCGVLEGAALWCEAHLGASHPKTLRAWADLGEAADEDMAWPYAKKAWEKIAEAPLTDPTRPDLLRVSRALRGLGARFLTTDPAKALELFERDLEIRERADGADSPKLAVSLGNVARAAEAAGDSGRAERARARAADL